MSKTLVCLSETLPFYPQDVCKEKSYNFDSNASSDSINKIKSEKKDNLIPQDENKYTKQSTNLADPVVFKQSLSKKREASNILVECVKRRENMQNMEFVYSVPFENNFVSSSSIQTPNVGFHNNLRTTNTCLLTVDCFPEENLSDTSSADSGINSSKHSSPSQSLDNISGIDAELGSNLMDTDSVEETHDEIEKGDLSPKSAAISEDLHSLNLDESNQIKTAINESAKSPIIKSLFKNSASMLYFSTKDEIVSPLSPETLSLLKWKLSTITPVLIREAVLKCGFHLVDVDTTEDWIGTWGKHLKCLTFRKIKSFQKVNHYPGGFHLGRKDKLWNSIRKMQTKYGKEQFSFFPDTYVLPADIKILKKVWDEEKEQCWITKPCASARGTGVKVIHKWSQVPKNRPAVVQRYICDPYLINGSKFDLRVYVLVPSFNPLRIYVFEDGLVRFASEKYSLSNKSFGNRFVHLTNYSINRKSSAYTSNEDENLCQGHKWSLKSFWSYMTDSGIDVDSIKATIEDMIIKTVISSEAGISRLMRLHTRSSYNCFELFGFDIMLDKNLQPWLLEVNITPSLHSKSALDSNVKGNMVKDMLNIAGFEVPEKSEDSVHLPCKGNRHLPITRILSVEEKKKHTLFVSKYANVKNNILENLTRHDLSCLMESEDEYCRRGAFTRVFPTNNTYKYFVYFTRLNYYNVLLDAWEQTFYKNRDKGIDFLQKIQENILEQQNSQKECKKEEPEVLVTSSP